METLRLAVGVANVGDLDLAVSAADLGGQELPADLAEIDASEVAERDLDAAPFSAGGGNADGSLAAVVILDLDLDIDGALEPKGQVLEAREILANAAETSSPGAAGDDKDSGVALTGSEDNRAREAWPVV